MRPSDYRLNLLEKQNINLRRHVQILDDTIKEIKDICKHTTDSGNDLFKVLTKVIECQQLVTKVTN